MPTERQMKLTKESSCRSISVVTPLSESSPSLLRSSSELGGAYQLKVVNACLHNDDIALPQQPQQATLAFFYTYAWSSALEDPATTRRAEGTVGQKADDAVPKPTDSSSLKTWSRRGSHLRKKRVATAVGSLKHRWLPHRPLSAERWLTEVPHVVLGRHSGLPTKYRLVHECVSRVHARVICTTTPMMYHYFTRTFPLLTRDEDAMTSPVSLSGASTYLLINFGDNPVFVNQLCLPTRRSVRLCNNDLISFLECAFDVDGGIFDPLPSPPPHSDLMHRVRSDTQHGHCWTVAEATSKDELPTANKTSDTHAAPACREFTLCRPPLGKEHVWQQVEALVHASIRAGRCPPGVAGECNPSGDITAETPLPLMVKGDPVALWRPLPLPAALRERLFLGWNRCSRTPMVENVDDLSTRIRERKELSTNGDRATSVCSTVLGASGDLVGCGTCEDRALSDSPACTHPRGRNSSDPVSSTPEAQHPGTACASWMMGSELADAAGAVQSPLACQLLFDAAKARRARKAERKCCTDSGMGAREDSAAPSVKQQHTSHGALYSERTAVSPARLLQESTPVKQSYVMCDTSGSPSPEGESKLKELVRVLRARSQQADNCTSSCEGVGMRKSATVPCPLKERRISPHVCATDEEEEASHAPPPGPSGPGGAILRTSLPYLSVMTPTLPVYVFTRRSSSPPQATRERTTLGAGGSDVRGVQRYIYYYKTDDDAAMEGMAKTAQSTELLSMGGRIRDEEGRVTAADLATMGRDGTASPLSDETVWLDETEDGGIAGGQMTSAPARRKRRTRKPFGGR